MKQPGKKQSFLVVKSTTFQSIIDIVDYNSLNDLVDYTSCVSTETCYEITISEIPYDNYIIYSVKLFLTDHNPHLLLGVR